MTENMLRSRDGGIWLALVGVLLFGLTQWFWIDEPFDLSLGGQISGFYFSYSARAWDQHGFWNLKMAPCLFYHPKTTENYVPYLHHPCLASAITYAGYCVGGENEAGLRLFPVLLVILGLLAFYDLLRRAEVPLAGCAVLLLATQPGLLQYGAMVATCAGMAVTGLIGGTWAWFFWRRRPSVGRGVAASLVLLLLANLDWMTFLLWPACLLDARRFPAGKVRSAAFWSGLPLAAAAAAYVVWVAWVLGGIDRLPGHWRELSATLHQISPTFQTWWDSVSAYAIVCLGTPLLVLAALGAMTACRHRWSSLFDRAALMLLTAGILSSVVFFTRSASHEFWLVTMGPAVALLGHRGLGALVRGLARFARSPRTVGVASGGLAVAVAAFGLCSGVRLHQDYATDITVRRARAIDAAFEPGDLVLMPDPPLAVRFYMKTPMVPKVASREAFDDLVPLVRPGRRFIKRIFLAIPQEELPEHGWVTTRSAKRIPYIHRSIRYAPYPDHEKLWIVELDKDACFR